MEGSVWHFNWAEANWFKMRIRCCSEDGWTPTHPAYTAQELGQCTHAARKFTIPSASRHKRVVFKALLSLLRFSSSRLLCAGQMKPH